MQAVLSGCSIRRRLSDGVRILTHQRQHAAFGCPPCSASIQAIGVRDAAYSSDEALPLASTALEDLDSRRAIQPGC